MVILMNDDNGFFLNNYEKQKKEKAQKEHEIQKKRVEEYHKEIAVENKLEQEESKKSITEKFVEKMSEKQDEFNKYQKEIHKDDFEFSKKQESSNTNNNGVSYIDTKLIESKIDNINSLFAICFILPFILIGLSFLLFYIFSSIIILAVLPILLPIFVFSYLRESNATISMIDNAKIENANNVKLHIISKNMIFDIIWIVMSFVDLGFFNFLVGDVNDPISMILYFIIIINPIFIINSICFICILVYCIKDIDKMSKLKVDLKKNSKTNS